MYLRLNLLLRIKRLEKSNVRDRFSLRESVGSQITSNKVLER